MARTAITPRNTRIPPKLRWHTGKRRWEIIFRHPSTPWKRSFLTTPVADPSKVGKDAAEDYLLTQQDLIGAHRLGLKTLATSEQGAVTVNDIASALEKRYEQERRRSGKSLRSMLKHLRRELGHVKVESLTKGTVLEARERLSKQGLSDGSINRVMVHLNRAWVVAKDIELVSSLPTFRIPRYKEHIRKGLVSVEELAAVNAAEPWPAVRDRNEWAYRTGMRLSEVASLKIDLIDTERWTITLDGRDTKNDEDRTLYLSPSLRAIVQRRLADRQLGCPFLFHHEGEPIGDQGRWAEAWFRAGLPTRTTKKGHVRPMKIFHDLRRTAVTNMIDAGIDPQTAMEISGHKTRAIFDRYKITSRKAVRQAIEILDTHVGTLPTHTALPIRRLVPRATFTRHATARLAGTLGSPGTKTASAPPAATA